MRNTALTQIALVGISAVIIISYVRPTFADIRVTQDEIFQYADATLKANEFNTLLQQLLARERSFSNADRQALETFLPTEIDQFAVMQDLDMVVQSAGGRVTELVAGEVALPRPVEFEGYTEQPEISNRFMTQDFELTFMSAYNDFTTILRDLESTAYVLEIKSLEMNTDNDLANVGLFTFTMTVKVYALAPAAVTM